MQTKSQVIPLSSPDASDSVVKSGALMFFRALRTVGDYVAQIPDAASQAASDISDAWEESSRPNA